MRQWADLTGELVLRTLDEYSGLCWHALLKALGLEHVPPGEMQLWNCVCDLASADLISIDGFAQAEIMSAIRGLFDESAKAASAKIRSSIHWHNVQMVLSRSHLGAPKPSPNFSMIMNPIFGSPAKIVEQVDLFVLMPFAKALEPVYSDHIAGVAQTLHLSVFRANNFFAATTIMSDIWNAICGAGAVIADCTGGNPNVFYELGIAHTVGKPVILITQSADDVPFDLRHLRYIHYEYTPRGMSLFEKTLARAITESLHIYR